MLTRHNSDLWAIEVKCSTTANVDRGIHGARDNINLVKNGRYPEQSFIL